MMLLWSSLSSFFRCEKCLGTAAADLSYRLNWRLSTSEWLLLLLRLLLLVVVVVLPLSLFPPASEEREDAERRKKDEGLAVSEEKILCEWTVLESMSSWEKLFLNF